MRINAQTNIADEFARRQAEQAADLPDEVVRPGPQPHEPRLRLRKPRRKCWPFSGQLEFVIRYQKPDTRKITEHRTGLPESQRKAADQDLNLFKARLLAQELGIVAPRKIPVASICLWWIEQHLPDAGAALRQHHRFDTTRRNLVYVAEHFAGKTLGDLKPSEMTGYINARMKMQVRNWRGRADAPFTSRATAVSELYSFNRALVLYQAEHQLTWVPVLKLPYVVTRRERFLTTAEFGDLLLACQGRIKDRETGEWLTETVIDATTGEEVTRYVLRDEATIDRRRSMERAIIIGCYAGPRHQILVNLSWRHHPSRPCIDLDAEMIHRNGYGEDPTKGKPRLSSPIRPELIPYLKKWREEDQASGHWNIIRKRDGGTYFEMNHVFNDVVADAGLGADVTPHVLRHTAVTWALQDGYHPTTVADLIGLTVETAWKYRQWSLASAQEAVRRHIPTRRELEIAPHNAQDIPGRAKLYAPPAAASGNRRHSDRTRQRPIKPERGSKPRDTIRRRIADGATTALTDTGRKLRP